MAFNIFATATSDIPLANLDANFTMIGSSAVASTLYPTATTSITYGTTGTIHYFSGSGLAVTGGLTASSSTGGIIFGGGSTSNEVVTITNGVSGGSNGLAIQNNASNISGISFPINSAANAAYVYMKADGRSSTTGFLKTYVNDAVVTNVTSTGLAVTGTLSATGLVTQGTASGQNSVFGIVTGAGGANSGVAVVTGATGTGYLGFNNANSASIPGQLTYNHSTNTMNLYSSGPITFQPSGSTAMTLSSTGLAVTGTLSATGTGQVGTTLGVGAATPSASGAGITFPATQSASTDANTLDDYEEGTFTPSLGGTATYSSQIGRYTKVGRMVTINFDIIVAILGTGSTTLISGIPFTASATGVGRGSSGYFQSLAVNVIALTCYVDDSASTIGFISIAAAGGTATINPAIFGNGARVQGSVCYFA